MFVSVNGRRVRYERHGSGGSPIVLLHGIGDSHELWRHQVGALADRYDVVTVDLPGHGGSELGPGRVTLSSLADDVVALLSALRLSSPVVAGLSMGGGVAQSIAVAHGSLLRALILVSTSSELPAATQQRMIDRADRAEQEGMAAVVDVTVPRWFTPDFTEREPAEVALTRQIVLDTDPAGFAAVSRANAVRNLTAGLWHIRCPVLFVGGAADPADPHRALRIYREHIPSLESAIIPNTSHLVPVEAPGTFNPILLKFLERVDTAAKAGKGGEQA